MDLATLIGMLGALLAFAFMVYDSNQLQMFLEPKSPSFVLVGTMLGVMVRFSMGHFIKSLAVVAKTFARGNDDPQALIDEIVELAAVNRKDGLLALEKITISDPFLEEGIKMLIDGSNAEVVKQSMTKNMRGILERNALSEKVWRSMGDAAPAFGMIGTVIGLVAMMANMDDPKTIGTAMAVALLTTLWGSALANIVFLPVADKLKYRSTTEKLNLTIGIDGVMAIQAGQNPRVISSVLSSYLDPTRRVDFDKKKAK